MGYEGEDGRGDMEQSGTGDTEIPAAAAADAGDNAVGNGMGVIAGTGPGDSRKGNRERSWMGDADRCARGRGDDSSVLGMGSGEGYSASEYVRRRVSYRRCSSCRYMLTYVLT